MPRITPKICGVCPTTHHMASTKALDDLYKVDPPRPAKLIRELINTAFMFEDHALHFYFLGGPDFVVGPDAPAAERNILGVIAQGRSRDRRTGHRHPEARPQHHHGRSAAASSIRSAVFPAASRAA